MSPSEAYALLKSQPEGSVITAISKPGVVEGAVWAYVLIKRPGGYRWYDLGNPQDTFGYDTMGASVFLVESEMYIWSMS